MSAISITESLDKFKESFLWVAAQSGNSEGEQKSNYQISDPNM